MQEQSVEDQLVKQFKVMFTREALQENPYLIFKMNPKLEIPLQSIYVEKKICQISSDQSQILRSLKKVDIITVYEQQQFVVPKIEQKITKIVINNINQKENDEFGQFLGQSNIKYDNVLIDKENCWRIEFSQQTKAQQFFSWINDNSYKEIKLQAYIEPENIYLNMLQHFVDKQQGDTTQIDTQNNYQQQGIDFQNNQYENHQQYIFQQQYFQQMQMNQYQQMFQNNQNNQMFVRRAREQHYQQYPINNYQFNNQLPYNDYCFPQQQQFHQFPRQQQPFSFNQQPFKQNQSQKQYSGRKIENIETSKQYSDKKKVIQNQDEQIKKEENPINLNSEDFPALGNTPKKLNEEKEKKSFHISFSKKQKKSSLKENTPKNSAELKLESILPVQEYNNIKLEVEESKNMTKQDFVLSPGQNNEIDYQKTIEKFSELNFSAIEQQQQDEQI